MSRVTRPIRIAGSAAYVPLTRGYVAVIDAGDVSLVAGHNWSALVSKRRKAVYAARVVTDGRKQTMVLMHRLVSSAPVGMVVDHIDGDGLNNRRSNIRHCTRAQNNLNVGLRGDSTSRLKGTSLDKRVNRWKAEIGLGGKRKFLGYFETPELAHAAYAAAAAEVHGEYARCK